MNDRTQYQAVLDVKYGQRLNYLHAKLYNRINGFFNFVNLLCGTAAFGAFSANKPDIILIIGLLIAVTSIFSILVNPAVKSAEFAEKSRNYAKLGVAANNLTLAELDEQLLELQSDTTPVIEGVRVIAYNDNMLENGQHDYLIPVSWWQSFLRLVN